LKHARWIKRGAVARRSDERSELRCIWRTLRKCLCRKGFRVARKFIEVRGAPAIATVATCVSSLAGAVGEKSTGGKFFTCFCRRTDAAAAKTALSPDLGS
jgi:hypothetical protein